MSDYGLVSIIVPVYHLEKYICETMDCILAQTYSNWELILVEDAGGDRTADIIEAYIEEKKESRIRLLRQEQNMGAAEARNRGVEESKGRFVAYLDGDDIWEPEKLERQLAFMLERKAAFCFTGYEFADENAVGNGRVVHVPETLSYKQALRNTTIFTSTVMFDTALLPRDQIVMPKVKSEDTALWWKLLRETGPAYGLDENLVRYRRPGKSLSSNKLEAIRRIWFLYRGVEHLNVFESAVNFCFWAWRAVARRV